MVPNTTKDFPFVGSYNNQRISSIDPERTINWFEYRDPLGKKPQVLIPTSGLIDTGLIFSGQTNGVRAQFTLLGYQYLVVGNGAYRIDANSNVIFMGSLVNTNTGYVAIDANTFQIIFVDGINGYIWDTLLLTFTMITDSNFPSQPIDVCMLDNFFVVVEGGTPNFYLSSYDQRISMG